MTRLSDDQVKLLVVERRKAQEARDQLTAGVSPESLQANPMTLVARLPNLLEAFKLTSRVEEMSNQLVSELVQRVVESQKAIGG